MGTSGATALCFLELGSSSAGGRLEKKQKRCFINKWLTWETPLHYVWWKLNIYKADDSELLNSSWLKSTIPCPEALQRAGCQDQAVENFCPCILAPLCSSSCLWEAQRQVPAVLHLLTSICPLTQIRTHAHCFTCLENLWCIS